MRDRIRRYWWTPFATIAVGALGSGAWEVAMKPALTAISDVVLTVGTLGLASLRDDVYLEIARGFHEDASVIWLFMVTGLMLFVGVCAVLGVADWKVFDAIRPPMGSERPASVDPPTPADVAGLKTRSDTRRERLARLRQFSVAGGLYVTVLSVFLLTRILYVNRAIVFFKQSLAAAAPHLTPEQEERVLARFAVMTTRDQYIELTSELGQTIAAHSEKAPTFSIW